MTKWSNTFKTLQALFTSWRCVHFPPGTVVLPVTVMGREAISSQLGGTSSLDLRDALPPALVASASLSAASVAFPPLSAEPAPFSPVAASLSLKK